MQTFKISPRKPLTALLAASLICWSLQVAAQSDDEAAEADYLSLAALMIKDGQFARAGDALDQVDQSAKDFDPQRFHTLRGMVYQKQDMHRETIEAFASALEAGETDPLLFVYMAGAALQLKEYDEANGYLDQSGELENTLPAVLNLRARIALAREDYNQAWALLDRARMTFPAEKDFRRQQFFLAIRLNLFLKAAEIGREFLAQSDISKTDFIAIANALTQAGEAESALAFLEQARLRYPGEKDVYVGLAHAYLEINQTQSAAAVLDEGSRYIPALHKDAAELYRRANNIDRALYMNAQVQDQPEKIRQRLSIYVDGQQYEQIVAMENDLARLRLLDEQPIRYALAYSFYKTGDFTRAEALLETITDTSLFRKSAELRRSMAGCADARWLCL